MNTFNQIDITANSQADAQVNAFASAMNVMQNNDAVDMNC